MRKLLDAGNVDNSNPADYPDGRIKDNTGAGDGTPVNEFTKGDIHQTVMKAKRLYGITENGLPDNETNGFQMLEGFIALASKNDFILSITEVSGVLNVPVKLPFMLVGEQIVCKSAVDKAAQTTIIGSVGAAHTVTFVGNFKANEYVRLIKTGELTATLVRLVDAVNADLVAGENGYLKKASQSESDEGTLDTVAVTPLVDKVTFAKRVNGDDSPTYLAVPTGAGEQNGLMSKEDKFKLDNFESSVKNIGSIVGVEVASGSTGSTYTVTGDIVSATVQSSGSSASVIRVVVDNTLGGLDYFVRISVQSASSSMISDSNLRTPVFKVVNATTFDICIAEISGSTQNINIFIETVKL